jgi:hypothetical protein
MIALSVQEGSTMLSQPHTNLKSDKICDYCHKRNHTRENCWDLHGKTARSRGCGRGQGRGRGSGRSGDPQQAHVADSTSNPTSFSDEMMAQLMTQLAAWLTSTTSMSSTPPPIAPSGVDDYNLPSLLTTAVKPVSIIVKTLTTGPNPDKSWIVDSGASKHMTPDFTLFKTYKPMSGRDKVQTTDGSLCPIVGGRDITCTSDLHLSSVFHVTNFINNLLSISQLIDDLNCVVSLSHTHVVL